MKTNYSLWKECLLSLELQNLFYDSGILPNHFIHPDNIGNDFLGEECLVR